MRVDIAVPLHIPSSTTRRHVCKNEYSTFIYSAPSGRYNLTQSKSGSLTCRYSDSTGLSWCLSIEILK